MQTRILCMIVLWLVGSCGSQEPDISELGKDVRAPLSPAPNTKAPPQSYPLLIRGAVRYAVFESPWPNDARTLVLRRYRDLDAKNKQFALTQTEVDAAARLYDTVGIRHLTRRLDEETAPDSRARRTWARFEDLHNSLQRIADDVKASMRRNFGEEVSWFLERLPQVKAIETVLVPTSGPMGKFSSRQGQVDFVRDRIERPRVLRIFHAMEAREDPTLTGAWAQLRGDFQQYVGQHASFGLHVPSPSRPFIAMSSRQFAKLMHDGVEPAERQRFTEYARFVESPDRWIRANEGVMDQKALDYTFWTSADQVIGEYINHVAGSWQTHGSALGRGTLGKLKDALSTQKPIESFGDFLDRRMGDPYLRMRFLGALSVETHHVAMRRFSMLMGERITLGGVVRGTDGSPVANQGVGVLYSDKANKVVLGNPQTDGQGRFKIVLTRGQILSKLEGRKLGDGRRVVALVGKAESSPASFEQLILGPIVELNVGQERRRIVGHLPDTAFGLRAHPNNRTPWPDSEHYGYAGLTYYDVDYNLWKRQHGRVPRAAVSYQIAWVTPELARSGGWKKDPTFKFYKPINIVKRQGNLLIQERTGEFMQQIVWLAHPTKWAVGRVGVSPQHLHLLDDAVKLLQEKIDEVAEVSIDR